MRFSVSMLVAITGFAFTVQAGETRFGRPVVKLAEPNKYEFFKLDDNSFPVLSDNQVAVTCMTYRGKKRYYVEVGVLNRTKVVFSLTQGFVSMDKPGYSLIRTNTYDDAVDVAASVAGRFIPTPPAPPGSATTTSSGTAQTYGNTTTYSGTSQTTVDDSAAGWHALGQAIAARRYYSTQSREQSFAQFLALAAPEGQDRIVGPGQTRVLVFTFTPIKRKKAPFSVVITVNDRRFVFSYKE